MAAHEEVWALLGERPIESLIELPLMTDPDMKAVIDASAALFARAFFTDNNLLILTCAGWSPSPCATATRTPPCPAMPGTAWCWAPSSSGTGRACLRQLGLRARRAPRLLRLPGEVLSSMELISYWTRPLARALELVRDAFQHALQGG